MEETLGKRIVSNRKRLGLTQDQLAERLGVTAQAVSKWENDQSCPDISMLPRLAQIFGITIDALLGCAQPEQEKVFEGEIVANQGTTEEAEKEGLHFQKGDWEFHYDGGKKSGIGMALWVLLVGGLLLASNILDWDAALWSILWPTGLLIFGLFGLYPRFSFFRLGCTLFGGYFLLTNLGIGIFAQIGREYILPIGILLFGLSLLVESLRRPRKNKITVNHNGRKQCSEYQLDDNSFRCTTAFGEDSHVIQLPRLSHGKAEVSFGELTVNLSGAEALAENCLIDANCSFGELRFLVPRRWRVVFNSETAFAGINVKGHPDPNPQGELTLDADVSFGEITVQYI